MAKTKLLMINSRFEPIVGGGETYMMELMDHFSSLGWEVHLATNNNGRTGDWHDSQIHYIDGFCDNDLRQKSYSPLRRIIDSIKPDLVHVHNVMPFFAYSSVVADNEFPTVLTVHDTPRVPERLFGRLNNYNAECVFFRELMSNNRCNKLVMGSQYYLDSYAVAAPQIKLGNFAEVVHYFLPEATAGPGQLRTRDLNDGGEVKILFPSRIVERKGIEDMLKVLVELPQRFTLLVPGFASCDDSAYREKIKSIVDQLKLDDRIYLSDRIIAPEKMRDYYSEADLMVMPSHYEGFGITALDGMSWGLPVIASDTGGLSEIIKDGVNGLLTMPKDTSGVKAAILRIVSDAQLRLSLTKNSLEIIDQQFSRAGHLKKIEGIYQNLL